MNFFVILIYLLLIGVLGFIFYKMLIGLIKDIKNRKKVVSDKVENSNDISDDKS